MRKKILAVVLITFLFISVVFGGDFKSSLRNTIKDFGIKYVSINPLFKPFAADSWNITTRAQVINLLDTEGIYQTLAFTRYEGGRESEYYKFDTIKSDQQENFLYEVVPFRDKQNAIKQLYRVKTGFNCSALRINYKDIVTTELCVQGALNLVFDAKNGTDCFGFDGIYFYGLNGSILNDLFSFRIGKHHYSGHYGDEIEESYMLLKDNRGRMYADRMSLPRTTPGAITRLIQYVRQDSLIIGLSTQPISWLRVYGELDMIPGSIFRIRPWVLVPENIKPADENEAANGVSLEQEIGSSEGAYESRYESRVSPYSSGYKDMTIETGVEFTIPVKDIIDIKLGVDFKFFQEAMTGYQVGSFDETNKWDTDINVLLGIGFEDVPVNAELIYHKGRVPLMNFFWQQCSYWSVGFSIEY